MIGLCVKNKLDALLMFGKFSRITNNLFRLT